MGGVTELLREAHAVGLTLRVEADRLVIRGPRRAEMIAKRLLDRKPEVIAALTGQDRESDGWDWWDWLHPEDYARITAPHVVPAPCPWCGGRYRHNPLCDELRASWEVVMPFGKHKGTPIRDVPRDYLTWLTQRSDVRGELREEIEHVLRGEHAQLAGNLTRPLDNWPLDANNKTSRPGVVTTQAALTTTTL